MTIDFTVHGLPQTQGNHRVSRAGRIYDSNRNLMAWRDSVKWAVVKDFATRTRPLVNGAVALEVIFYLPRPKSTRRELPAVKPDLSKLVRSTEDALTEVGAYEDDSRIVQLNISKRYCSHDEMSTPGARIRIRSMA